MRLLSKESKMKNHVKAIYDSFSLGITNNYMGSYYVINFGDGTAPLTYTQDEPLDISSGLITQVANIDEITNN